MTRLFSIPLIIHINESIHEGWGGVDTLPRGRLSPPHWPPPTSLTMFIGTRYEKLFSVSSWKAFRNFKWPGSSQSLWSLHKNESIHEGWGGGTLNPGVDCPPHPCLLTFLGTRLEKLYPASSWRAFRNFKWPGSSQSLWSLHKNGSIHEGWGGGTGDSLPRGRLSPPPLTLFTGTRCEKLFSVSS